MKKRFKTVRSENDKDLLRKLESVSGQLRELALNHEHPSTRERFLALFEIAPSKTATQISRETGRNHQTVIRWVHKYNKEGDESLFYRRTGSSLLLFAPRWTLKRLVLWIKKTHGLNCCRETVRKTLKKRGFSWKKWRIWVIFVMYREFRIKKPALTDVPSKASFYSRFTD